MPGCERGIARPGSPVQGELAADRLTEGLTAGEKRAVQPVRVRGKRQPLRRALRVTSPYTGEARRAVQARAAGENGGFSPLPGEDSASVQKNAVEVQIPA